MTSTERSPQRMGGYINELKSVLADKGLGSGRPQDLVPVADMLRVPGVVREDLAAAIRSILSREAGGLSRAQVASMLAMAVGGTGLYVTSQEVDAVGRLDEFADWLMAPPAKVAVGGDAVAQAVEPFWGIVGGAAGEAGGASVDSSPEAVSDATDHGKASHTEVRPAATFLASPTRSNAPWILGVCAVLVLVVGGIVWKYQQAPQDEDRASAPTAASAVAQPNEVPRGVTAANEAAASAGLAAGIGSASVSAALNPNPERSAASNLGVQGPGGAATTPQQSATTTPQQEGTRTSAAKPLSRQGADLGPSPKPSVAAAATQHTTPASRPASIATTSATASANAGPTGKFLVSSGMMSGHLITAPEPSYPKMAKMWGIQGEVVLQAVVSRKGQVVAAHAMDGHKLLRGAAENSVKKWRYRPYIKNGKPTDVDTVVIVNFHLPS